MMSWRTNSKRGFASRCPMLAFCPVKRLSMQITSWPSLSRRSQRWDPRKPAPPVTRIRIRRATVGDYKSVFEQIRSIPHPGTPPTSAGQCRQLYTGRPRPCAAGGRGIPAGEKRQGTTNMKTMKAIALGFASLIWAGASYGQQTMTTTTPSVHDYPGLLGRSYGELAYTWHNIHNNADAYDIGGMANIPVAPGFDAQVGYDYFWWNDSTDPTTVQQYDYRLHTLAAGAKFFGFNGMNGRAFKPFLGGQIGYAWSRGDFSRLTTFGHEWLYDVTGGAEFAVSNIAITPRVGFADTMHRASVGGWHYGAEAHAWFTEKLGGFADATYHDPQHDFGPSYWSYTGGLRLRW